MAVFGIPVVHEDDALRAVRAAAEMRAALAELNADLEREWSVTLQTRIGVNTGDVVAGDPIAGQALVTGRRGQHRRTPGAGGRRRARS